MKKRTNLNWILWNGYTKKSVFFYRVLFCIIKSNDSGKSMTKNLLSDSVIEKLKTIPNVKSVSTKGITYTLEFRKLFIERYLDGEDAVTIFELCGFMEEKIDEIIRQDRSVYPIVYVYCVYLWKRKQRNEIIYIISKVTTKQKIF